MTTSHSMHDDDLVQENNGDVVEENDGDAAPENDDFVREGRLVQDPVESEADPAMTQDPDVLILVPDQDPAEATADPVTETGLDPLADATADPVTETGLDPLADATADPVTETGPDPLADATADPVTETGPGLVTDGSAEPVTQSAPGLAQEAGPAVIPPRTPPDDAFAADVPPTMPDNRWREIQAMFVDDPRGSVEQAADLASERLRELGRQLQQRERDLRAAWQDNADTEVLRTSLQSYRALVDRIAELSRPS
jgi:hypothetical protein